MSNEQDIINLLGTGGDSDLSSLSSDEEVMGNFPERELENLLHDFDYDLDGMIDYTAKIAESCEEMGLKTKETEMEIEVPPINNQVNDVLDLSILPIQNILISQRSNKNKNKWSRFISILKKYIF